MAGNYKNLVSQRKEIICKDFFEDIIHDEPAPRFQKQPLEFLPTSMLKDFTYDNRILIKRYFFTDSFPSNRDSGIESLDGAKSYKLF